MLVKKSENILPITPISYIEEAYPVIELAHVVQKKFLCSEGVIIIEDIERMLTIKVIVAFSLGIAIIYMTALLLGSQSKGKWFKQRQQTSFFNRRGILGETCHFGYPCTWQGLMITILMYGIIGLVGYGIIFRL